MNDHRHLQAEGSVQERLTRYIAVLAADGHRVGADAAELRSGQFHDVVLTAEVAYRFPRDAASRDELPRRVALLTALADAGLPVAIPAPVGAPDALASERMRRPLGSCYVALSRVPGRPAAAVIADDAPGAAALAGQLADLLDRLAGLGAEAAVRRAVPAATASDWRDWSGQVRAVLFPLMSQAGRRRAEAELAAVETVAATGNALVHSDLGGANLLLAVSGDCGPGDAGPGEPGPAGQLTVTGILDWDGACIGNQANDLASLAVTFGWPLAAQVDQQRHSGTGSLIPAAQLIAATFAVQQALPAALSGDVPSLDDGLLRYR
jgi:Ser/Thr protein kinase RdoA (MazF antagonist)